jgi:hypothetical protein
LQAFESARYAENALHDAIRVRHIRETNAAEATTRRAEAVLRTAGDAVAKSRARLGEVSF